MLLVSYPLSFSFTTILCALLWDAAALTLELYFSVHTCPCQCQLETLERRGEKLPPVYFSLFVSLLFSPVKSALIQKTELVSALVSLCQSTVSLISLHRGHQQQPRGTFSSAGIRTPVPGPQRGPLLLLLPPPPQSVFSPGIVSGWALFPQFALLVLQVLWNHFSLWNPHCVKFLVWFLFSWGNQGC